MFRFIAHLATILLLFGFTANSGTAFTLSSDRSQYAVSSFYRNRFKHKNITHYRIQEGFVQSLKCFFKFYFSSFQDNFNRYIQTLFGQRRKYSLNIPNYISTLLSSWRSRHAKAKPYANK